MEPKRFSEVYRDDPSSLAEALEKVTDHKLFICGHCDEPIRTNMRDRITAHTIHEKIRFCTKCGSEIDWSRYSENIIKSCPKCHTSHGKEDLFCIYCGSKLDGFKKEGF